MGAWVIGHNIAGYMPESDTYAYAEWQEAHDAFVEMCREYAEENDEANDAMAEPDWSDDDYGSMRACVDSILKDSDHKSLTVFGPDGNPACGMTVADNDDRWISFWLQWEPTREPDDDAE